MIVIYLNTFNFVFETQMIEVNSDKILSNKTSNSKSNNNHP